MEVAHRLPPNMQSRQANGPRFYRGKPLPPEVILPPEGTDQETYDLLIQMQLEELGNAAPAPHQADPNAHGDEMDDEAFARMLQEQEENGGDEDVGRVHGGFDADLELARKLQEEEDAAAGMARLKVADKAQNTKKRKRGESESDDEVVMVEEWKEQPESKNRRAVATKEVSNSAPIAKGKRKRRNTEDCLIDMDNSAGTQTQTQTQKQKQKQKQENPPQQIVSRTKNDNERNDYQRPSVNLADESSPPPCKEKEEEEGKGGEKEKEKEQQDNDWAYDKKLPPHKKETKKETPPPSPPSEEERDPDWAYGAYDKKPPPRKENLETKTNTKTNTNMRTRSDPQVSEDDLELEEEEEQQWQKSFVAMPRLKTRVFEGDLTLAKFLAEEEEERERRDRELAERLYEEERREVEEERWRNQESLQLVEKLLAEEREESQRRQEALLSDEEIARQMMAEWEQAEEEREREQLIKDNECYICLDHEDTVELECKHMVHVECARQYINTTGSKAGGKVNPAAARCGQCRKWMAHPELDNLVAPLKQLYERVAAMALQRKAQEDPQPLSAPIFTRRGRKKKNNNVQQAQPAPKLDEEATDQLLRDFVYYMCAKCKSPYYGGRRQCQVAQEEEPEVAQDRICNMCANAHQTQAAECPVDGHGVTYVEYKCRYCCNVANFFCWGTTHFCEMCHRKTGKVQLAVIPCPGLPMCAGHHPPNDGKEHCLGCALCRDVATH